MISWLLVWKSQLRKKWIGRVWSALRSFLNSSTSHFRSLLKITWLDENMQKFLLEPHSTPWESFVWRKNRFLVLKSFWKCSQVFFQVKRNQKHIYNVFIRPKVSSLKLLENWKNHLQFWLPAMGEMTLSWLPAFTQQNGH